MKIKFLKLRVDNNGNSGLECWECEADAKYLLCNNGYYCKNCKLEIQESKIKPHKAL